MEALSGLGVFGAPGEYSSAICVPSGDQRGVESGPFACVSIRARRAATSQIATWPWPRASVVTKAMRRPSGDHAIWSSSQAVPAQAVTRVAAAGRATSASAIALRSPAVATYANRRPSGARATWANSCTPSSAAPIASNVIGRAAPVALCADPVVDAARAASGSASAQAAKRRNGMRDRTDARTALSCAAGESRRVLQRDERWDRRPVRLVQRVLVRVCVHGGGYAPSLMLRPAALASVVLAGLALAATSAPPRALAAELATVRGTIALPSSASASRCGELVVEARAALDDHLIGLTQPAAGDDGACRYALTVPAQTAVWLSVHTGAVLAPVNAARLDPVELHARPGRPARAAVALRFTVIAASTFFFAPGEEATVPLAFAPAHLPV